MGPSLGTTSDGGTPLQLYIAFSDDDDFLELWIEESESGENQRKSSPFRIISFDCLLYKIHRSGRLHPTDFVGRFIRLKIDDKERRNSVAVLYFLQ